MLLHNVIPFNSLAFSFPACWLSTLETALGVFMLLGNRNPL